MNKYNLNLTLDEIFQSLQKDFFVPVPFPMKQAMLTQAIEAFFRFLEEPEDIKNHIDFSIAPLHRRGDVGFRHREADEHLYNDTKDFFHFHPALFDKYHDFLAEQPVVLDFVSKAKPIWEMASETVSAMLQAFEPAFPGIHSRVFDTEHPHLLLRFLKYEWQCVGKYLAKPHYDAGSFTLAIAESNPGLRIGSGQDNLKPIVHKEETALFMLSSNMQKVMDTEELRPAWHDVVQIDETIIGKPCARWAIVAFIDGHNVEALPRTETHKWYAA